MPRPYCMPDPSIAVTDEVIMNQIEAGSRVIDLGCGDGRLLEKLRDLHQCSQIQGIELDLASVRVAISRGVPVIQSNLDHGLPDFPDNSYDYAVLSQTLQQIAFPKAAILEMLRVARRALVVVPNFGNWKVRLQVAWNGRAPVTTSMPYEWYETPNRHFMSMFDFRSMATQLNVRVIKELPIIGNKAVNRAWIANLRADSALYVLEKNRSAEGSEFATAKVS